MPLHRIAWTCRCACACSSGALRRCLALATAFWYFQVAARAVPRDGGEQPQRTLPLRPRARVLFDRRGAVLVENRYAFDVSIVREQTSDLVRTAQAVAQLTGAPDDTHRTEPLERSRRLPAYRPTLVIGDATEAQIAAIAARRLELPEVIVEKVPTRRYPDSMAAHLIGYVGEVDRRAAGPARYEAPGGAVMGQSGVEQTYNPLLMGTDGARNVVVNSAGARSTPRRGGARRGRRLQLTIDDDLQRAAEEAFRHYGFCGAAVVLAPSSGEVLALRRCRPIDPNAFAAGIDRADWDGAHRSAAAAAEPGHPGTVLAGLDLQDRGGDGGPRGGRGHARHRIFCGGGATFYGRFFKCHRPAATARCRCATRSRSRATCYFYTVGNMLGVDRIHKWATALGLGEKSGIDLPHESQGLVPSTAWKKQRTGEKWYAGETISVAIGQGQVSVTPMSLAVMMATVANGGTRIMPHLVRAVDEGKGWEPVPPPGRDGPRHVARACRRRARRPVDGGQRRRHRRARQDRRP